MRCDRDGPCFQRSFPAPAGSLRAIPLTPPHPGFEKLSLAILQRLDWSAIEGDVGRLSGGALVLAATDTSAVEWTAVEGNAPEGLAPRLITKDATTALREGKLEQDGSIACKGARFRLSDVFDGSRLVAQLVPATKHAT